MQDIRKLLISYAIVNATMSLTMMAEVLVQKNGAFMLLQMLNVRQNSLQKLKQKNVPHDVYNYDDPDDFADDWAEEFDGGNYDGGYDDAYDYWEENYGK